MAVELVSASTTLLVLHNSGEFLDSLISADSYANTVGCGEGASEVERRWMVLTQLSYQATSAGVQQQEQLVLDSWIFMPSSWPLWPTICRVQTGCTMKGLVLHSLHKTIEQTINDIKSSMRCATLKKQLNQVAPPLTAATVTPWSLMPPPLASVSTHCHHSLPLTGTPTCHYLLLTAHCWYQVATHWLWHDPKLPVREHVLWSTQRACYAVYRRALIIYHAATNYYGAFQLSAEREECLQTVQVW